MPALRVAAVQAAYVLRLLPPGFLERSGPWLEEGNTVIVAPNGTMLAGPVREREETLVADLDLLTVAIQRRHLDPAGHYNRPDVFRLHVDTSPRPAVVETPDTSLTQATASPQNGAVQHGTVPHVAAEHVAAQNSE